MFDGPSLEDIGLIKFDILGLKALTVISKTIEFVKETRNEIINIESIPEDDSYAYDLIAKGNSIAVFQIEGSKALRDFAAASRPENIEDISAIIALYRPGPIGLGALDEYILRKKGINKSEFDIPEYNYLFESTYGLLCFQEQLMALSGDMCGFDDIERDVLRKATAKKDPVLLASLKEKFVDGAVKHSGQDKDIVSKLFDSMSEFARYSFNKSHSVAYAYIAYQTAYLKCHYPSEFMASSISCEPDPDQQSVYMSDARKNGVNVMPPDINQSGKNFKVGKDGEILFGFNSVKGVGTKAVDKLLSLQPFDSFGDFLIRVFYIKGINKRVIDTLVCSGACDAFGYRRSNVLAAYEKFMIDYTNDCPEEYNSIHAKEFCKKEESYFIDNDLSEFPILKILEMEKELLGVHISGNPFDIIGSLIKERHVTFKTLNEASKGHFYTLCQINKVNAIKTKKGDSMAFIEVIDSVGDLTNMVVFPGIYKKVAGNLNVDKYVVISLTVKEDIKGKSFLVGQIYDLTKTIDKISDKVDEEKNIKSVKLYIEETSPIRFKSIVKSITSFKSDKVTGYTGELFIIFGNTVFRIEKIDIKKIDITMLRAFSRISGLKVERSK